MVPRVLILEDAQSVAIYAIALVVAKLKVLNPFGE